MDTVKIMINKDVILKNIKSMTTVELEFLVYVQNQEKPIAEISCQQIQEEFGICKRTLLSMITRLKQLGLVQI